MSQVNTQEVKKSRLNDINVNAEEVLITPQDLEMNYRYQSPDEYLFSKLEK